ACRTARQRRLRTAAEAIHQGHRAVGDHPRTPPWPALHQRSGREPRQAAEGRAPPPPQRQL
ncbi:MAG: hypothetical protein AVDCRST_MAG73-1439, partial [uncultured Thermomicrobiales bacterium]